MTRRWREKDSNPRSPGESRVKCSPLWGGMRWLMQKLSLCARNLRAGRARRLSPTAPRDRCARLVIRRGPDVRVERVTANGVRAEWTSTPLDNSDAALLYLHC